MVKNTTEKVARILKKMRERDRKSLKHWKPYRGPADWSFIVLDVPQQPLEGKRDEPTEVSSG